MRSADRCRLRSSACRRKRYFRDTPLGHLPVLDVFPFPLQSFLSFFMDRDGPRGGVSRQETADFSRFTPPYFRPNLRQTLELVIPIALIARRDHLCQRRSSFDRGERRHPVLFSPGQTCAPLPEKVSLDLRPGLARMGPQARLGVWLVVARRPRSTCRSLWGTTLSFPTLLVLRPYRTADGILIDRDDSPQELSYTSGSSTSSRLMRRWVSPHLIAFLRASA